MITDRELARYISSNLHLYLADEDKPVECKVVDVSKNNGGTVAGVQILMHGVDHGPVISMETIRELLDIGMPREEVMKNIAELVHKEENIILLNKFDPEDYQSMKEYLSVMVINTDANIVSIHMIGIQSPFIRWMKVCMIRIANSLNLNSLNLEWRRIMDWFTKRNR